MPRIVAIDYGSKRVGIAATDPLQIIASAVTTVGSHEIMAYLEKYLQTEVVECIVVGEAKNLDGSAADSTRIIEEFVKGLRKKFPQVKIEMQDERFTSKMAFDAILQSGISKSKRRDKKLVDKVSAVLILQSYLERKNNNF
ncbi:MAG: Holliday junction resolvase RuvX [Sphingobacteriales bacterium]|nr:MAG: Holliday junction resolvase RuvX [Sphingobacteriales bacterium]